MIPPVRLVRDGESTSCSSCCWPTCARPTCAAATCARRSAANRLAEARLARAGRAARARRRRRRRSRRCSPTPSGAPARRCAELPDGTYEARRRDRGRRRRPTRTSRSRCAVDDRRRRARDRLRRHRRPGRRQRQLPARGHALGLLLRAAGRCCPTTCRPTRAPTRRSSIEAPEGSLVNAQSPAAVVAGNVETSQRDRRHRARRAGAGGRAARPQGQGTMNNLIIGGRGWTYYETIGGGQGASAQGAGPSRRARRDDATRSTRRSRRSSSSTRCASSATSCATASGGDGEHRGGDGVVRAVRVLEPATLSLLTDRRRHAPGRARRRRRRRVRRRTCSTARSCRRRPRASSPRATS